MTVKLEDIRMEDSKSFFTSNINTFFTLRYEQREFKVEYNRKEMENKVKIRWVLSSNDEKGFENILRIEESEKDTIAYFKYAQRLVADYLNNKK